MALNFQLIWLYLKLWTCVCVDQTYFSAAGKKSGNHLFHFFLEVYSSYWQASVCCCYFLPVFILTSSLKERFPKALCVHIYRPWLSLTRKGFQAYKEKIPSSSSKKLFTKYQTPGWLLEDLMDFFQVGKGTCWPQHLSVPFSVPAQGTQQFSFIQSSECTWCQTEDHVVS